MSSVSTAPNQELIAPWWLVLIEGIAAIIVGVLLFIRPAVTTILLVQFLGIYWLVSGVFTLISLIWDRTAWGWKLVNAALGILAGLLIVQNPLWSTLLVPATLAVMMGVLGMLIGILQLIDAFRGGGWGVGILGGLSILLGFLLITRPVIAGLALPLLLGGLLVAGGLLTIIGAFALRSIVRKVEASAADQRPSPASRAVEPVSVSPVAAPMAVAGMAAADLAAVEGIAEPAAEETTAAEADEMVAASMPAVASTEDTASSAMEKSVDRTPELPEAAWTGNVDTADLAEMAKFKHELQYVEGIGPAYASKLELAGLTTCLDLLQAGATRKGREAIVAQTGLANALVLKWVNHVDLYRIKGVGSEYADLLEASGVDTVVELAQRNPSNLYARLREVNAEKALVRQMPTSSQVADWIGQAKDLSRVVSY